MDKDLLMGLLDSIAEGKDNGWKHKQDASQLLEMYKSYYYDSGLEPGDLVCWKKGLKDRKTPNYDEPAVLVEIIRGQREKKEDAGSLYFMSPIEARVGVVDKDGDFITWFVDLNRLERYTGE